HPNPLERCGHHYPLSSNAVTACSTVPARPPVFPSTAPWHALCGPLRTMAGRSTMTNAMKLLLAAGIGATAMYYLDPARGRYRRALLRDGLTHAGHRTQHELGVVGRDTRNRTVGLRARLRNLLRAEPPDDDVLVSRVR